MSLLDIRGLTLSIGDIAILHGINLRVDAGQVLGIIGESGSGKSMSALSVMQLLPRHRPALAVSFLTVPTCCRNPSARCAPSAAATSAWCSRNR
jgi:ABC-type glutathione transport system ATPase component